MGKTSPRFPPSPGAAQQILYWVTATTTSHTDILCIAYTGYYDKNCRIGIILQKHRALRAVQTKYRRILIKKVFFGHKAYWSRIARALIVIRDTVESPSRMAGVESVESEESVETLLEFR